MSSQYTEVFTHTYLHFFTKETMKEIPIYTSVSKQISYDIKPTYD